MADVDDLDKKPWTQQRGETNPAFHAYTHFMTLLAHERSMDRAYTNHQRLCQHNTASSEGQKLLTCSPSWQAWRFRFSWVERTAAHDAFLAERDRLMRVHEIDQMNRRHTQISLALQNLVIERLQTVASTGEVFKMTPTQMAALLDRAALVERRSRGEATSIVQHHGDGSAGVALDLSKLSDEELAIFQQLVGKAQPTTPVKQEP